MNLTVLRLRAASRRRELTDQERDHLESVAEDMAEDRKRGWS